MNTSKLMTLDTRGGEKKSIKQISVEDKCRTGHYYLFVLRKGGGGIWGGGGGKMKKRTKED